MATLHTLLDRADAAAGTPGEARAWLLLLLKHAETRPQALPPDHPRPPQEAREPAPSAATFPSPAALTSQEEFSAPVKSPPPVNSSVPVESSAPENSSAPEQSPAPGASSLSPRSTPPSPSELPLERASSSEALDQAFAPLEIAFPPLPSPERPETRAPSPEPAPAPPPLDATRAFRGSFGLPTSADPSPSSTPVVANADAPPDGASVGQEASNRAPAGQPASSAPRAAELSSSEESFHALDPLDHFPTAVAAPVPTFHGDALESRSSSETPKRPQAQTPEEPSAPTARAKSLQAWRAWLPGAFRPRPRA